MRFKVRGRYTVLSLPAIIGAILALATFIFWQVEINLKPTLTAIAETKAIIAATQTINNVIKTEAASMIDTKNLVDVNLDDKGRVVLIRPNTLELNRLAAGTAVKVQSALKEMPNEKIYIPLGQISGSQLLAAMGPDIVVTVVPMGTVEVKVVDTFEQAGINQTRHMIYLAVVTQIRIVIPLVSKSALVNTQIPVAEYIIVGEVPNTYVQFPSSPHTESAR